MSASLRLRNCPADAGCVCARAQNAALKERAERFTAGSVVLARPEQKDKAVKEIERGRKEWRQRKAIVSALSIGRLCLCVCVCVCVVAVLRQLTAAVCSAWPCSTQSARAWTRSRPS